MSMNNGTTHQYSELEHRSFLSILLGNDNKIAESTNQ
jgi:hypothetical protein